MVLGQGLFKIKIILSLFLMFGLAACSSMPTTQSKFFESKKNLSTQQGMVHVYWGASDAGVTQAEQAALMQLLKLELQTALKAKGVGKGIRVRSVITRVETVNPTLNWIYTILFIIPFDRGGAAVEFEVIDKESNQVLSRYSFAEWTPLSEFKARFDRLEPTELALQSSVASFIKQL